MTPDHEERLGAEVSREAEPGAVLPKRAGLTNAAFKILSSGLNFLLVPLYIHVYGLSTYGALSLLLALGQYLSVLDVGITGTLVQTYLRVRTHGDYSYFRLRQLAISFLFAAGGGLAVGGGLSAQWWAPAVGLKQVSDLSLAIFSAGSLVVLMLVSNCLNSAYVATLRFGWVNVYSLSLNILPQLVSAGAYAWIGSLGPSLTLGAVAACAVVGLQSYVLRREERPIRPKHVSARVSTRLFLESSATFSLQTLLGALLMPLLQTVVGMRFGNQANALLDVSRRLLFAARQALEAIFVPLFARASELQAAHRFAQLRKLAIVSITASLIGAVVFYLVLALILDALLVAWLGTIVASQVAPVARILLLGVAFTCPHIGVYQVLSTTSHGRRVNIGAAAVSLLIVSTSFFRETATLHQVLWTYVAATGVGAVLTLGAAVPYLTRLTEIMFQSQVTSRADLG